MADGAARTLPRGARRALIALAALGVAVVVVATPLRNWWSQRNEISAAESELEALVADNDVLADRLEAGRDPAELERMARRELGMVREGEESYAVLPPPTSGLVLPDVWPFDRLAPALIEAVDAEPRAGEPGAGEPGAGEPGAGEPGAGEPGAGEPEPTAPDAEVGGG